MVRSDSLYRPRVEMKLTRSLLAVPYLPYLPYLPYYYCNGLSSQPELILASLAILAEPDRTTRRAFLFECYPYISLSIEY